MGAGGQARGVVLVEFAIVVPLFLAVALSAFELARVLRMSQLSNVVSQEVANAVFRGCADYQFPNLTPAKITARTNRCLQRTVVRFQSRFDILLPDQISIVTTVYHYRPADDEVVRVGYFPDPSLEDEAPTGVPDPVRPGTGCSASGKALVCTGKQILAEEDVVGDDQCTMQSCSGRKRFVVVETTYHYQPLLKPMTALFGGDYVERVVL
jgi:hypothetical protein